MAVPAYTTDLVDIADLDTTGGAAVEPASLYTAGRSPEETDTDFAIQGTVHASLTMNTTGKAGVLVPGDTFTHTSGEYIFGWIIWLSPAAIATYASGGLSMLLGSSATNFDVHWVGGSDFGKYPYGGWQNFAVDPERTPDESNGTSPTAYHYVGAGANVLSAVSKGNPLGFDVFRYGRGIAQIDAGQAGSLGTFAGLAAINDASTARWGLFQAVGAGSYQWKGLMSFGSISACLFTDSNVNINIENTELVSSDFNRIEINNTSSVINWTNVSFSALGTVAKGELEMIDNAEFNDIAGTFTDMGTFGYLSNYTATRRTWRRCGLVTGGGGSFVDCIFDASAASSAITVATINDLEGCSFAIGTAGHAVTLTGAAGAYTWDCTLSGYDVGSVGSGVEVTGASITGDEAIHVTATTGTIIINVSATGSTPSVSSAGAVVNVVAGLKTFSFTVNPSITGYEWRLYEDSVTPGVIGTVELDGEETATVDNQSYSYSTQPVSVALQIIADGYEEFIGYYTLGAVDQDINVGLTVEGNAEGGGWTAEGPLYTPDGDILTTPDGEEVEDI